MRQTLKRLIGLLLGLILATPAKASVMLNEIFPNPVDENDEFIELYNSGNEAVDITGYQVADLTKTFTITDATISAKNWFVLPKVQTKIALNNDTETVTLKDNLNQTIDSFSYDGTDEGWSYSRINDGQTWIGKTPLSQGAANIAPAQPSSSPTAASSPSPAAEPSTPAPNSPSPSPSALPSAALKTAKVNNIILLTKATPEPVSSSSVSPAVAGDNTVDWQLIIILLVTGTGLLITPAIIIIRQWRKNGTLGSL